MKNDNKPSSPDSSSRVEKDSLGEVNVPINALYGAQTQRAYENFPISGIAMPRMFIRALGLIKHACAKANGSLDCLDLPLSDAIAHASMAVAEGQYDAHFPVDVFQTGSGTSTNMNANEVIAKLSTQSLHQEVHPNDHVNRGQSSNDVIPSCIHISATLAIEEHLLPAMKKLSETIDAKSKTLEKVVKTGRTHLMDAMPVTMAQELSAWSAQIQQCETLIEEASPRLLELAIGGTAVGSGVNTHPMFSENVCDVLTSTTSYPFTPKSNFFEALSSQNTALELSGKLKNFAASLMKICNDLRWMNSGPNSGLAEITLPALQPGSSIMPGKVNPVIPEAVTMAAAQVIGNDTTISIAAQSGNFQLNTMLPVIAYNLLQSIELLSNSADLLATKVIAGFEVNSELLAEKLLHNPVLVTALAPKIGYEKCAEISHIALTEKRRVIDVAREHTDLDDEELEAMLNPFNLFGN